MSENEIVEFASRNHDDQISDVIKIEKVRKGRYVDLWTVGEKFIGKQWTVLDSDILRFFRVGRSAWSHSYVQLQCSCGFIKEQRGWDILNGKLPVACMGHSTRPATTSLYITPLPTVTKKSVSPAPTTKSKKETQDQKREKQMANAFKLIWNSDTDGHDARTPLGNIVELKSCGTGKCFALGRQITPSKVDQYESEYWGFSFYSSIRTDARRGDSYFTHPIGLDEKWAKLRQKFVDAQFFIDREIGYAKSGMIAAGYPPPYIEDHQRRMGLLYTRALAIPNDSIAKGYVFRAVDLGLGIKIDDQGDVIDQIASFEKAHPLKKKRK